MRAHSHRTCAACMHRHRTCSSCLSLPHPPGLMRALAPYARSGAVWAALRVHPRLQPLRVHEHRPRVGPALSESLSFSVSLSLSPVGPKCTRARTARALLATTTRALQQGHFTQTGQHVCLYLERTLGSASHVCALATRRTSFLFLYFSHPPGLIFARSHARPGRHRFSMGAWLKQSHFSLQSQICQIHYSAQSSALKAIKYHCSIHHIDCTILEPSTVQCITTAWMPFVQHTYK